MEQTNIVQKLLKGSAEIDRMRLEIDQLISLIIGYINQIRGGLDLPGRLGSLGRQGVRFESGMETWIVGRIADGSNRIFVELVVSPRSGMRTVYSSEWKKLGKKVETEHVRGVYKALPRLVTELEKKFPNLTSAWAPLIKAAG